MMNVKLYRPVLRLEFTNFNLIWNHNKNHKTIQSLGIIAELYFPIERKVY